jgi:hypothetical protein
VPVAAVHENDSPEAAENKIRLSAKRALPSPAGDSALRMRVTRDFSVERSVERLTTNLSPTLLPAFWPLLTTSSPSSIPTNLGATGTGCNERAVADTWADIFVASWAVTS